MTGTPSPAGARTRPDDRPLPEDEVRALFDAVPTPCVVLRANGVICEANAAYTAMVHRRREDLIGRTLQEVFPPSSVSGRSDAVDWVTDSLRRVYTSGRP